MMKGNDQKMLTQTASELYSDEKAAEGTLEIQIDRLYQEALTSYVEAKLYQVGIIEDKLEILVDRQKISVQ